MARDPRNHDRRIAGLAEERDGEVPLEVGDEFVVGEALQ